MCNLPVLLICAWLLCLYPLLALDSHTPFPFVKIETVDRLTTPLYNVTRVMSGIWGNVVYYVLGYPCYLLAAVICAEL